MSDYRGDFLANANVIGRFTTRANANSVPTLLVGGNLLVFKGNANGNVADGVTLLAGSITGVNVWTVATAANQTFYTPGADFDVVVSTGTVGGSSVVGEVVGGFSIQNRVVATVTGNLVGNVLGNMNGNVNGSLLGNVAGNILGNVAGTTANITGTPNVNAVSGNLTGNPNVNVTGWLGVAPQQLGAANGIVVNGVNGGNIVANVTGNMTGSVGSMNGNVGGNVLGNVVGNVVGNVIGTTGNIIGNPNVGFVLNDIQGSLLGNVQGDVVGDLGGSVQGDVAGNIGGSLQGNVFGNVVGSVGNISQNAANLMANTLLDFANGIETGITPRLALRYTLSASAGNLTGGNTLVTVIRGGGVGTVRITAAVEADGNTRTVTLS